MNSLAEMFRRNIDGTQQPAYTQLSPAVDYSAYQNQAMNLATTAEPTKSMAQQYYDADVAPQPAAVPAVGSVAPTTANSPSLAQQFYDADVSPDGVAAGAGGMQAYAANGATQANATGGGLAQGMANGQFIPFGDTNGKAGIMNVNGRQLLVSANGSVKELPSTFSQNLGLGVSAVKAIGGLASIYLGFKQYGLAKDTFNFNKKASEADYKMRAQAFNAEQGRKRKMVEGYAGKKVNPNDDRFKRASESL